MKITLFIFMYIVANWYN